jgi:DNA replication and repair protein RecF
VYIDGIELSDFRNYQTLSYTPSANLNLLTGANAQGKTNLLEALGVFLVGRSFRGARAPELPRWGTPYAMLSGEIRRGDHVRVVRRVVRQRDDGAWAITGEGCPWARAIPFAWTDLAIVTGGPQARRNFLDGFVAKIYPAYGATYRRYRQVLARRNHLLQTGADAVRLEPWTEQLVNVGLEVLSRRREGVRALQHALEQLDGVLGSCAAVTLAYRSSLGEQATADEFRCAVAARAADERRRGQTIVGPHRDDLEIALDGRELRVYGSRGQQRLVALVLRLAEAGPVRDAVGSPPVLLLDDALSELDADVQRRVLEHVKGAGQVFLTTADTEMAEREEACWWEVQSGTITTSPLTAVRGAA